MHRSRKIQHVDKPKGMVLPFGYLLLCMFLMCRCTAEYVPPKPSHTVVCYLGGNNNLSASIEAQINELQAGYVASLANVFVYAALPSGAKLVQLTEGNSPLLIEEYESGTASSAETFAEVIASCRRRAPAQTYSLVVASHGSGWLPAGTLQNPQHAPLARSIIADDDARAREMELADFARAIPDGLFDAIVLEACLMGGVEVAYALRNKGRFMLVAPAELLDPGFTPIYRNALQLLCATSTDTQTRLIRFAEQYMRYINNLSGAHRSATLSVIDLAKMEPLADAFVRGVGQLPIMTQQQLATIQHFDRPGWYGDKPALARFFDLEDAVNRLTGGGKELSEAVDGAVCWKASTSTFMPSMGGFSIDHYCGLTTYIRQEGLPLLNEAYHNTEWWQRTSTDVPRRIEKKEQL